VQRSPQTTSIAYIGFLKGPGIAGIRWMNKPRKPGKKTNVQPEGQGPPC
jgi:hypothetical protein